MKLRPESTEAGITAIHAFLALGAIAFVAILVVLVVALASQDKTSPIVIVPDIGNNSAEETNVTPTVAPHELRIVTGKDAGVSLNESVNGTDVGQDGWSATAIPKHIAFAFQPNVSGIACFTAYWTVPDRPQHAGDWPRPVFLWTGIQQGSLGLVQAVLEWDNTINLSGKGWTLACWAVNKRGPTMTSPRLRVGPGDRIKAELRYEANASGTGGMMWHIIMTDETNGGTTELFDSYGAVNTNLNVTVFSGVLEGIASVAGAEDLPGDTTFSNVTYLDENGTIMPMHLTGYVIPEFPQVAVEYEDGPSGTPVVIHTKYDE
jgi:hypothetical protein